jgi:hypothetical protein
MERRVVCAAVRSPEGQVICSARHFDQLMRSIITACGLWSRAEVEPWEQGFIDQFGVFMTREEAHLVAKAAGQIIRHCGGDGGALFSENLY